MRFLVALMVCGCAGEIRDVGGGGGGDPSPAPDAGIVEPPPSFACRPVVTANLRNGEHNPGQDCNGSCHDHGFTLGGTLFAQVAGAAPFAGATITVIDANGMSFDLVTARNGNFYTEQALAFPAKVIASGCPDVRPMVTQVTAADAGCNRGGCHVAGATGQIHLP
jgi:hypothetical protein